MPPLTTGRRAQADQLINFIVAHDVLLWAGAILAIAGVVLLLTRVRYASFNVEDMMVGLICAASLIGAHFGREPLQVLGATDAGTIALTAELMALLLTLLLVRYRLGQQE